MTTPGEIALLDPGSSVGPFQIRRLLGRGGPPSLTAAVGRSYGGSTEATERTWP